jgi:hypothetical protein
MPMLGIRGQGGLVAVLGAVEAAASNRVSEPETCSVLVVEVVVNVIVVVCVAWIGRLCSSTRTSPGSWPDEAIEALCGTIRCPVEVSPVREVCRCWELLWSFSNRSDFLTNVQVWFD